MIVASIRQIVDDLRAKQAARTHQQSLREINDADFFRGQGAPSEDRLFFDGPSRLAIMRQIVTTPIEKARRS